MKDRRDINRFIGIIGIVLCSVILIALLIYDYHDVPKYSYAYFGKGGRELTKELSKGSLVTQQIPNHAGDEGLSFMFTTFGRRVSGELTVRAVGEKSGFVYIDRTIPGGNIKNNEYVDFFFPEDTPALNEILSVSFSADSEPDSGMAIMTTGTDSIPGHRLVIDGEEMETDLFIRRIISSSAEHFPLIMLGIILAAGIPLAVFLMLRKPPLETVYACVSLFLGILYMFIMTPFSIPDEKFHYDSAFTLSNLLFSPDKDAGERQYFDFSGLEGHKNVRTGYDRIVDEFFKPSDPGEVIKITRKSLPYPLMYLPQTLGLSLGRLLRLNFLMTFYLGRLCSLLFFAACVYLAIRITPRFKLLFCMIGLMPMALHQAASYSYDTFINGLSILFIALILKLANGEGRISFTEMLPAVLTGILICPAKPVYAPMLLMLFMIPVRRFGTLRKLILILVGIGLLAGVASLAARIGDFSGLMSPSAEPVPGSASELSAEFQNGSGYYSGTFLIYHPKTALKIFVDTLKSYELWFVWLQQCVGSRLAGLSLSVDVWHIFAYLVLLIISSFPCFGEATVIQAGERFLMLFISACVITATMFFMFICCTPYGDPIILGVQGRYFIPILPLLCMCFHTKMIEIRGPIEKVLISAAVFIDLSILNQVLLITMKG